MTTESLEELRERLLGQHGVQQMIQIRAYEIFQMRGGNPGGEAQDWFHAECEVLAFLLASESAPADERAEKQSSEATSNPKAPPTRKAKVRTVAKSAAAKEVAPRKAAPKRAATRKSGGAKSKSKKPDKQTNPHETGR